MNAPPVIADATEADIEPIFAIYDHFVLNTTATFETEPRSEAERRAWFEAHDPLAHALLVAKDPSSGDLLGWAGLSPWSPRAAYRRTAEVSVYIALDAHRRGVGRALMHALIKRARTNRFGVLIARIAGPSDASRAFHASAGFQPVGLMRRCGSKFGSLHDVLIMDLHLEA
ncbi:MAG: N-acetyltransferase family protein [Phycisphaerales bacterium]